MTKPEMLRARVNETLKARVTDYIASQGKRGMSVSESDVVIQAVVNYLDAHAVNSVDDAEAVLLAAKMNDAATSVRQPQAAEPAAPARYAKAARRASKK